MRALQKSIVFLSFLALSAFRLDVEPPPVPERHEMEPPRTAQPLLPSAPEPWAPATKERGKDDAVGAQRTVKIGLLVPMSGHFMDLGKAMSDAAMLALFDKYESVPKRARTVKLELLIKDSGDSSDMAEKAAREAVKDGAGIILGPVFSNQVGAVVTHARQREIPIVSFSNNPFIAGPGVFIFGLLPDQQVRRVANFAVDHGVTHISALLPSNPYGAATIKPLVDAVSDAGYSVRPISYYPDNSVDLGTPAKHLAKDIHQAQEPVQALFIAEGGSRIAQLQRALTESKISGLNLQMIGSGAWENPEILRYPNFYGGIFATASLARYDEFSSHFTERYSYVPDRRASLAYDAAALAATLALKPTGPDFTIGTLTSPIGYIGPANGLFRLLPDGTNERGMAVIQITSRGFKTIDKAPDSFLK